MYLDAHRAEGILRRAEVQKPVGVFRRVFPGDSSAVEQYSHGFEIRHTELCVRRGRKIEIECLSAADRQGIFNDAGLLFAAALCGCLRFVLCEREMCGLCRRVFGDQIRLTEQCFREICLYPGAGAVRQKSNFLRCCIGQQCRRQCDAASADHIAVICPDFLCPRRQIGIAADQVTVCPERVAEHRAA